MVTTSVTEHSFASTGGPTSSIVSKPGKKSSLTGAIAGGVGGGVAVLAIVGRPVFYFVWQRLHPQAPSTAFMVNGKMPAPSMSHEGHAVLTQ